ncbi:DUF6168 family protein [Lacinutrix sp. MedPE-SW]|uniref:DUF6168 family protein n=1 Tax=Lacinutrix sp. MedPE-SW TaxID=1860087 RepID=UPI0009231ED9|nr:DUF6168 family protein [Lacinutrix sp. MedPE-SW]OIQ23537.1 MAG: hypothetical protein BM549_02935 [Lacinutrix sp. MedPE-SW]
MIKKILIYFFSFSILFGLAFTIQNQIITTFKIELGFSVLAIYSFHSIASFLICATILILSKAPKWQPQLGFVYIFSFVLKFLFFAAVFKESIFKAENLSKTESLNLLIPLGIFLFLEVYFIAKILNQKD